jgi:hypothetical protein
MPVPYDEKYIIRPGIPKQLTNEQLMELLKCAQDVKYFASKYYTIIHAVKGEMTIPLFDYQKRLLDCYQNNIKSIVLAPRQCGKAIFIDTPIMTEKGFTNVGNLKVGDNIYGKNGKKTEITFITETMYDREVYNVEFDNGEIIKADADHLWTVKLGGIKGEKTITTTEIIELKEKYSKKKAPPDIYIDYIKPLDFDEVPLPIPPYILGLWIGNDSTRDGRITCSRNDYHFYKSRFEQLGYKVSEFRLDKRTGNFNVVGLNHQLTLLGMKKDKYIPENYIFNSVDNRLEFINGMMDSNGYCTTKGTCTFYQSVEHIIDKIRLIFSSLGIKTTKNMTRTANKDAYNLEFCTKHQVFSLPRKLDRQKMMKGNPKNTRIYFSSIKKIKSVPVRCLQVDNEDHLFLCGETLIPTHNTTTSCIYLLWYAIFNSKKEIAILANKQSIAIDILDDIKKGYEMLPAWMKPGIVTYNNKDIVFENGTKIFASATTENSLRGHSCSVIFLDEFSHIHANVTEKFWPSTLPVISTGGSIIVVSTPNGASGKFYELYKEAEAGTNGFKPFTINWDDVPGRDEAWRETMMSQMGSKVKFNQEFCNSFTGSTQTLINGDKLGDMKLKESNPLFIITDFYHLWKKYDQTHVYAFGIDSAQGAGSDFSVITIWDITDYPISGKYELVGLYRRNDMNIFNFAKEVLELAKKWGNPIINCETNETGLGNILVNQLYFQDGYERIFYDAVREKWGVLSSEKTKKLATTYFKEDVEKGLCTITSQTVISELGIFEEKSGHNGTFAARKGKGFHDDTVAACYWTSYMLKSPWFLDDMMKELYSKNIPTNIIKEETDVEKLAEQELNTWNSLFGQVVDPEANWEKELWRD